MHILVKRQTFTEKSTIGSLYINGEFYCYTLEDKVREATEKKVYGETAIPYGTYPIIYRKEGTTYESYKTRFADIKNDRGILYLREIPGYEYVLIHCGNRPEDTLGCLLVGSAIGNNSITGSEIAYRKIYPVIASALDKGEEVKITIGN